MAQNRGASVTPTGLGAPEGAEPHSRLVASPAIPSASGRDVLDELKRRDPDRYGNVERIGFTPGPEWDGSVEQIADAMQSVDRELANPYRNCASRLGGEAFILRDSAMQQFDYAEGYPGKPIPLTREQKRAGRLSELLEEASRLLLAAASAIEAATAGETVKHGSTEGESAVGATSAETPALSSPRRG